MHSANLETQIVKTIVKQIKILKVGSKYTVHVFVDGRLDAQYALGSRPWAESLAEMLANNDCPRCLKTDITAFSGAERSDAPQSK